MKFIIVNSDDTYGLYNPLITTGFYTTSIEISVGGTNIIVTDIDRFEKV